MTLKTRRLHCPHRGLCLPRFNGRVSDWKIARRACALVCQSFRISSSNSSIEKELQTVKPKTPEISLQTRRLSCGAVAVVAAAFGYAAAPCGTQ
jgi:hypothetical protein